MGDVYCKICGEPWDLGGVLPALHGHEDEADMTKAEAEMLLKGKGCPSCKGKPRENRDFDDLYFAGLLEADGEIDVIDFLL